MVQTTTGAARDERRFSSAEVTRRGAHRARQSAATSVLPLLAAAALLFGVISMAYVVSKNFIGGNTKSSNSAAPAENPPASASQAPATNASSSSAPGRTTVLTVDKTKPIDFYNATNPPINGLSRKVAATLAKKGWKTGKIESWKGDPLSGRTTIYYGSSSQKATADAINQELAVDAEVLLVPTREGKPIAVVISDDYPAS